MFCLDPMSIRSMMFQIWESCDAWCLVSISGTDDIPPCPCGMWDRRGSNDGTMLPDYWQVRCLKKATFTPF